jgi:prepilin signal peptidase PulO-like enzyme (type II secretory pathway)
VVDLLPVVGYVVRRGGCASCSSSIGASAPVVEAVSGACVLAAIAWFGLWPGAPIGFVLIVVWGFAVIGLGFRRRESARNPG